jgi:hypothetical protein
MACFMAAMLGGCVALEDGPERVFPVKDQVAFVQANQQPMSVPIPIGDAKQDQAARNYFVTERVYLIDLEFSPYFARLTTQNQAGNLAGDLALLGLTFSSTVLASAATKTVLSAAATAVTGARTAIDQDVLLSKTVQILLLQMETSRNLIRARIEGNLQACSISEYTVWQALTDLEDYYRAGTLPGALESLAAATGNNNQQSKDVKNGQTQMSTPAPTSSGQSQTNNGAPVATLAAPKQTKSTTTCNANSQPSHVAAARAVRSMQLQP